MTFLKQADTVTVQLGPALDKTDGVTEETGLSPTVEVSKAGAAFAARNSATAIAHDANGWYRVELDGTDTGTIGRLVAKFDDAATHLPVWHEFHIIDGATYDALFADTPTGFDSNGRVDIGAWLGTAVTVSGTTALPEVDAKSISDNAAAADNVQVNIGNLDAAISGLNDPTSAAIADAVWDEAKSGHVGVGSFGEEVQAHALSSEVSSLNDPTSASIADAVWDEAKSGHVGVGSFGEEVQAHALSGEVSSLNDPTSASIADAVWDEARSGHVAGGSFGEGVLVQTNSDKTGYALSASGIDAILDEPITEPSGTFAWGSATLRNIVGWLGALSRNKMTRTSTTQTLRNDSDAADIAASTVSDDGTTATRGEFS